MDDFYPYSVGYAFLPSTENISLSLTNSILYFSSDTTHL